MSEVLRPGDQPSSKPEPRSLLHRERRSSLWPAPSAGGGRREGWDGPTYYGRPQLKSAPFNNWLVGAYIFLVGMTGSASLIGTIADGVGGKPAEGVGRRARLLGALAPILGAPLLIMDLHTPQRFYNMLRLFKARSPMSIGAWLLVGYSAAAVPAAIAEALARVPGLGWLRGPGKAAQVPAAAGGAGLSVYTASLLSATSTPAWAAASHELAVRFGASSVASGAAALLLGEEDAETRRTLGLIAAGALGVEAAAAAAQTKAYADKGIAHATKDPWGRTETILGKGLGLGAPLALFAASLLMGRRGRSLGQAAAVATLAGSAIFRIATLGMGDESALRPEVSMRFAQRDNLGKPGIAGERRTGDVSP